MECYGIIYKATNNINKKVYIGKTIGSLKSRKRSHISASKRGSSFFFHNALRKYNYDFTWEVLYNSKSEEELSEVEKSYIWFFMSNNKQFGYNLTEGGEGISGFKFPENYNRHIKDKNGSYKEVDDKLILLLHNKGKNVPEINKITNISKRIIHKRLKWNGLKCNDRFEKKEIDIEKVHYFIENGLYYTDIAKLLNVSVSIVSKRYRESKYYKEKRSKWRSIKKGIKVSDNKRKTNINIDEVHKYILNGLTYIDIANKLNVNKNIIGKRYRESIYYTGSLKNKTGSKFNVQNLC